jgi:hypothetical protein
VPASVAAREDSRQTPGVSALPEPPRLRAVMGSDGDPLEREGLALAYAALEHVRRGAGFAQLTVAVEDARLGRQLLTVPRTVLPGPLESTVRWSATPPSGDDIADLAVVRALCRVALRAALVEGPATDAFDGVELALRELGGVEAIAIDSEHDVVRVQVAAATTGDDLAHRTLEVVRRHLDRAVVVEVVRGDPPAGARPGTPISWVPASPFELLALRSDPVRGEVEVHVGGGDVRTVGRAPLTRGLLGAAEAALDAWHQRPGAPRRSVGWAHIVETSSDAPVVVAVALEDARRVTVAHGIGDGTTQLEAAARATVDALSR